MQTIRKLWPCRCHGVGGHAARVLRKTVEYVVKRCRVVLPATAHTRPDTYSYRAGVVGRALERLPTVAVGVEGRGPGTGVGFPFPKYDTSG
jgi:hypothetical protein